MACFFFIRHSLHRGGSSRLSPSKLGTSTEHLLKATRITSVPKQDRNTVISTASAMKLPTSRLKTFLIVIGLGLAASVLLLFVLTEFYEEITAVWLRGIDDAITNYLHLHASSPLTYAMFALSFLGQWKTLLPITAAGFLWLMVKRLRREAVILGAAVGGASLINVLLKLWFQRPRPSPLWALAHETSYSFPSGHAVAAVVFYGAMAFIAWRRIRYHAGGVLIVMTALLLILGTGTSRVYLGVHFPSDVAAGYLVGSTWLAAVIAASKKLSRPRQQELPHSSQPRA
jgi:undecaprenyl-diphosphatase